MDTRLTQALEAINHKDFDRARQMLRGYVALYPRSEEGWLWLSWVAENPDEKIQCLERVVQINPKNAEAVWDLGAHLRVQRRAPAPIRTVRRVAQPVVAHPIPVTPIVPGARSVSRLEIQPRAPSKTYAPSGSSPSANRKFAENVLAKPVTHSVNRLRIKPPAPSTTHPPINNFPMASSWSVNNELTQSVLRVVKGITFVLALVFFLAVGASTVPVFMGNRSLVIISGSMEPEIPTGAVVIAQPVASKDLAVGDVIAFATDSDKLPTVHRITNIRVTNNLRYYTTQGDANRTADPGEVNLPSTAWRVGYSLPWVGYLISFAVSIPGIFTLIILPLGLLGLSTLWEEMQKHKFALPGANRLT